MMDEEALLPIPSLFAVGQGHGRALLSILRWLRVPQEDDPEIFLLQGLFEASQLEAGHHSSQKEVRVQYGLRTGKEMNKSIYSDVV